MARLLERYRQEIIPQMQERLGYKNKMAVPRLEKIVVSMGINKKETEDKNRMGAATKDLALITGQKPLITRARKSIAGFKLRKNDPVGCKVTLRGRRMYEFLDRLINIVLPRVRDFRGLNKKSFDRHGNFNLGIDEQAVFPEISIEDVKFVQGMDITIVTNSKSDDPSFELLKLFGMPFRS